ncbi:MAG: diguanylate cyclase [Campylobacterota bacterium]|nr:diguanylate cyclase [Campylobacterota bacterium]
MNILTPKKVNCDKILFMKIVKKFYKHLLIFAIVLLLSNLAVDYFFKNQKDKYLNSQTELLTTSYETQYKYFKIMSNDIYIMYQDNEKLRSVFSQAKDANSSEQVVLRNKMHKMLQKRYKRLANMGIRQLHFHLPNNVSFLRMHKVEKFGDDLSDFRESVVYVNATKKPAESFEIGKDSHAFRFVYPFFDKNREHIGSVEISFYSETLLNNIADKFVLDKHFLTLKSEVDKNTWPKSIAQIYEDSLENRDYYIAKGGHSRSYDEEIKDNFKDVELLERVYQNMKKGVAFSISGTYNYNSIATSFIPIKNIINDKTVAYIALYFESDYIDSISTDKRYTKILLSIVLTLLFLFTIYATITQEKLKEMAHFDELTALPNRAYFYIELTQEIKRAKRLKEELCLMFVDLDGFKRVNDTYGHNVGDELLIRVARRLENSIRDVDIVGRIGGDEFTVLLTGVKSIEDSRVVAEKIILELNKDFVINSNKINISASIGLAEYPHHGQDLETLINNADNAMYSVKKSGKNAYLVHENKN